MEDRNKTALTHDVTNATVQWLDDRGFKPVETEVYLCCGWSADIAGVICPTQTELINLKLLPRRPSWNAVRREDRNESGHAERRAAWNAEWDAKYAELDRVMTCLVEVKTSRGDFLGDKKWGLPLPCDLAFLAVPRGLTAPQEWPEGWGILEFHDGSIRRLRPPVPVTTAISQQRDVILQIAIRRDHHTRYERWRESARQRRVEDGAAKAMHRVADITRGLLNVAHGRYGSPEGAMSFTGIRNINAALMERIAKLWNVAPQGE